MNDLKFEFRRRLPADAVYSYEPVSESATPLWKRTDKDLWVKFISKLGWVCVDNNDEVFSIPWLLPWDEQGDLPPEGKWVSCKGDKSYVYDIVYISKNG